MGRTVLFDHHWTRSLKGQCLKSSGQFAATVERDGEGIAASCSAEEKISLGFVEGLKAKIRIIKRRVYSL